MKKIILILLFLIFISFKTGDNKSNYTVPRAAYSVTAGDIDMDGDNDIVVGHKTAWQNTNPTLTLLENINNGLFEVIDTSNSFCGYQENILLININIDSFPDIISFMCDFSSGVAERYIRIFYNNYGAFNLFQDFPLNNNEVFSDINFGDINGDFSNDIIVASGNGHFWGVLYNDGAGNFPEPEYHYVTDYYPYYIASGDLNGDGRDDIVVCGQSTEVFFSYPGGFQSLLLETNNFKEGVSIVDFDLDGDNDILTFVGIPFVNVTSLIMYKNQGNNSFDTLEDFYFQPISSKFFVTDFNNDSLSDILFQLSDKSGFVIYYNQGNFQLADSQFVALPPSSPQESWRNIYCADMDGNGFNDIIAIKTIFVQIPDNLIILFNDGNGNFVEDPITDIQSPNFKLQTSNLSCYPNPSRSFGTTISFSLEKNTFVTLQILDIKGTLINTLINNELLSGKHKTIWNGKTLNGKKVNAGLYLVRLKSGWNIYTQRIVVNK